jgi:PilZ domain
MAAYVLGSVHISMAPANPLAAAQSPRTQTNPNSANSAAPERRRRVRSSVHWPVILFRNGEGEEAIETITRDLSSSGFYCLSRKPFTVGELLVCALLVPTEDPAGRESRLECRVLVVRVEEDAATGQYGIACRTEDYRLSARY